MISLHYTNTSHTKAYNTIYAACNIVEAIYSFTATPYSYGRPSPMTTSQYVRYRRTDGRQYSCQQPIVLRAEVRSAKTDRDEIWKDCSSSKHRKVRACIAQPCPTSISLIAGLSM